MPTVPSFVFPRSFLYVPGNRPELFAKAARSEADAVILDLEDSVPQHERLEAQRAVGRWLEEHDAAAANTPQWWVRLDPASPVEPITAGGLTGIVLAKADVATLDIVARALDTQDWTGSHRPRVIGLVETAAAHAGLAELVRHPVLTTLGIGEVDLLADLGMTLNAETLSAVNGLRLEVVKHCAAAGLLPPVAPTSTDIQDLSAFKQSTGLLSDLGFAARTAIHPRQVPVIHQVLTPSAERLAAARDIVERLERAGRGVALDDEGRLIDAAVVRQAQRIIERAAAHRQAPPDRRT